MDLIPTVSKISVNKQMEKLFNITLNLVCKEMVGDPPIPIEVMNKNFSVRYRPGLNNIEDKIIEAQTEMQKAINDYKAEQQILRAPQLDTSVISIQGNLVG